MRHARITAALAAVVLGACGQTSETTRRGVDARPAPTAAPVAAPTTFDHPAALTGGAAATVREALERMAEEGPPLYTARMHSCRKVPYQTVGRLLRAWGVDVDATGATSAGRIWREADQALGAPNYAARVPESTEVTAASSGRLFDIFVQAAPEIIAGMPEQSSCQIGGIGARLFETDGSCREDGITCLLGVPATEAHIAFCDTIVSRAETVEQGQKLAVAALLAAANTCE